MGAPLAQLRTTERLPDQIHPTHRPQTKPPTQITQGSSRTSPFLPTSFIASSHVSHDLAPPHYPASFYPFPGSAQSSRLLLIFPRGLVPVLLPFSLHLPEMPPDPCSPCPTSSPGLVRPSAKCSTTSPSLPPMHDDRFYLVHISSLLSNRCLFIAMSTELDSQLRGQRPFLSLTHRARHSQRSCSIDATFYISKFLIKT